MPDRINQFRDALALYRRHGWTLARVLMTPATLAQLPHATDANVADASVAGANVAGANVADVSAVDVSVADANVADASVADAADVAAAPAAFEGVAARESEVDAMWLSRPSAGGREAWELRLISDPPYALFELFEPDELEEDREDVRREMEARLAEYAAGGGKAEAGETGKG